MKYSVRVVFMIAVAIFSLSSCTKQVKVFTVNDIKIIPKPVSLVLNEGVFEFNKNTVFVVNNEEQHEIAAALTKKLKAAAGLDIQIVSKEVPTNFITFLQDETLAREGYILVSNASKISIAAKTNAGFVYGLETIRQLLPVAIESETLVSDTDWVIPAVTIKDEPRFKWRGLMLDLSRHFFGKDYLMKTIDRLALHKMNVLHLHLVDDQGWRIEIKKYPKLTEVGAWRVDQEDLHWNNREAVTATQKGSYGGFLTQEDLKEIVAYGLKKNVEIIPEIEMPAHVSSAIAAYPALSCFNTKIGVPSGGVWPITDIFCAGKEHTFEFLENVLLEVMDIFPSKYIHIGGDEATKTNWGKCPDCKKRMKAEGLENVEELQSYFIKRMEKFINAKGKKLVGWDEILEGGLAPDATVMSWRGVKGGLEAAKHGNDVVMTPGSHCYFDHYQGPRDEEPQAWGGHTSLSKVYTFDPVVEGMTAEEAKHVLGGQANLWAEFVPTESQSEYMIYPRIAALAETVWSPKESRNWDDFSERILTMFQRYEKLNINYAKSVYLITADTKMNLATNQLEVSLQNEFSNADIRYTLDGSPVNEQSNRYEKPFQLTTTTTLKASLFKNNKRIGRLFEKTINFHKAAGKKVTYIQAFSDSYKGPSEFGLVNVLRGTKNFKDGQWQGWIGNDLEIVIETEGVSFETITVGSMEDQGSGIYFPIAIKILVSEDGKTFTKVAEITRAFEKNAKSELKDFVIPVGNLQAAFVKVIAINHEKTAKGGGSWLFVDEILID
ncbi:MAG: beta-N-acetylhexosaminidase [Flavobacteriaceae bacterium]|nr:MAG: beta-N-acetylhexosaminidase [Flavobacteriaceae bacterium]